MHRTALPCALLACLIACLLVLCAPAGAATTATVPASQRLAEFAAKARKGNGGSSSDSRRLIERALGKGTARRRKTTPGGTATAPAGTVTAPTGTATSPAVGTTPARPASEASSSAAAANAITNQLRALEAQGKRGRKGHGSSKLSGAALALAILGGVLALGALLWAAFRFAAIEPHWLPSLRHSLAEAGFRASAIWSEFTDWARLGH